LEARRSLGAPGDGRVSVERFSVSKVIGIDLGTTNSCVAVMEGGAPQVIPNQEGARTTPSIVGFTAKGERLVGQIAKRQALTNPKNTVFAVKRLIGRKFNSAEVEQARRFMPYGLVESPNGDVHIQIEEKVYSPPEISSFVLQKLKAAAEDYLGEPVEEAIITVPAYFNDPQRQATKDAGLIAGLKVSRIINEPTAAALAYGLNKPSQGQLVAVYDLGGGTFDISILEMADGLFQVRATGGDTFLGGEDFDQRIIDWLIEEFLKETGIDLRQDRMALQRLKEAAEKAKCELSSAQQTEIVLPFISADASGPKHLNTVLTRQKYESLTDDLLDRTIEPCRRCLSDAGMKADQIDEVLLVGGQTRAPRVSEVVRRVFDKEPNRAVNPDEGVAMGAAIQTGIIAGEVKELVLLDVTPHTLGIETKDGTFTCLIERNSTIPTRKSRVFTTVADNQTKVEVHVLQGESDMAAYNKSLAKFELTNIPAAPKGVPQIEVTFEIDVNGIVSVSAQDQATGRSQSIVIHPSGGLSQSELSRLVSETRQRDQSDRARREEESVVQQLEGLVANTMRSVQALEGKLTSDEQDRILAAMERAKKARVEGGLDELKSRLAEMERAASLIGQAMLRP
jgi:molecular chaperone DnaK